MQPQAPPRSVNFAAGPDAEKGRSLSKPAAEQAQSLLGAKQDVEPAQARAADLQVYRRRWLVLTVVALLNNSNTLSWIAFANVANWVGDFYKRETAANDFSVIYMLVSIPVGFFAIWLGTYFGLRTAVMIAAWTNAVGAVLRFGSSFLPVDSFRFAVAITGQAIAAIAYPFIMFMPTKVAGSWFPDHQRGLATTIMVMANPLGVLLASLVSPAVVRQEDHVPWLNALTLVPCLTACALATLTVTRSDPPKPPTLSASQEHLPFWEGLRKCLRSRAYLLLFLVMGGGIGMFNCLYTVMQQLLCPKGYGNTFSGVCCALMIIGGVFGATGAGIFVDRTKMYEETMKVAIAMAVIGGVVFVQLALHPHLWAFIALACFTFGVFGLATYPVGLEMSSECTFPVSETTASGLIVLSGQLWSVVLVKMMEYLARPMLPQDASLQVCKVAGKDKESTATPKDMTTAVLVFSGVAVALVLILIVFFKPKLRRLHAEQQRTSASASTSAVAGGGNTVAVSLKTMNKRSEDVIA